MAEVAIFAKCKKCKIEVKCVGQSIQIFPPPPTNLVHHFKTGLGHEEEYERCNKLKTKSDEKKERPTSDGTQPRQVSLQETAELHKV